MLLNWQEINSLGIFKEGSYSDECFTNANYNLRVDKIIVLENSNGEDLSLYTLPPRGMVFVISKEVFEMPENVLGYTTVKNGLSLQGIMAVNVGIVYPLYQGPISSALINFGKKNVTIRRNEPFLRMTFHKFQTPSVQKNKIVTYNPQNYFISRRDTAYAYLDGTFLSLNSIKDEIYDEVKKRSREDAWMYSGRLTASALLLAAFVFLFSTMRDCTPRNKALENYDQRINNLEQILLKEKGSGGKEDNYEIQKKDSSNLLNNKLLPKKGK
jgi:deoxycytidine triphosphate deaminase